MNIKVYSDTICGWCYIGHTKLAKALSFFKDSTFDLEHVPFQLNPDMPKEGIKRIDYLKYKFGGIEIARPMYERMAEEGKKEGLSFVFDKIILTPNTSLSHLLIKLAYRKKIGLKIINEIFKSYFQEGIDIGNINNLIKIGKKFNLEEKEIKNFLLSEVEMKKINLSDSDARNKGITGVPFFNINNNTYISGAQSTENLIEAIKTNL